MSKILDDLRYAESHEWVKLEGDIATVGITDYAQHALGNMYVFFAVVGVLFLPGLIFGGFLSVKAASDLISPVSGEVVEINEALEDEPELVNQDAFGNWIMKVRVSDPSEIEKLLDAAAYAKICEE